MRGLNNGPWEVWAMLLGSVVLVAMPLVVGILITKLYRKFKPLPEPNVQTLASIGDVQGDSFLKMFFIGWGICGPLFYGVYLYYR